MKLIRQRSGIDDYEKGNVTDGKSSLKKLREKHGI